jgi:hypothetical protein
MLPALPYELGGEPVTTRDGAQATIVVAVWLFVLSFSTVPAQPVAVG